MICYEKKILKSLQKGKIPKEIFIHINNAFISLEKTLDFSLFDIKQLKTESSRKYFRLRKGKFRAIYYLDRESTFVIALDKREEVYKKWA
jgi:mRNA interferase RelE/StbE